MTTDIIDLVRDKFRDPQVEIADHVCVLGCSFVWGYGLEDHETMPHLLSQLIDAPVANLGICGAGSSLIADIITSGALDHARAVIIAWPHLARRHMFVGQELVNLGPWTLGGQDRPRDLDQSSWNQIKLEWQQALASGQAEAQALEARNSAWLVQQPCIEFAYYERLRLMGLKDLARDNLHPGRESQQALAQWLASWYQTRKSTHGI